MRLEGNRLSPNPIFWQAAEAGRIWIIDSFTWDHRFLSFRETEKSSNKHLAQGREDSRSGPGERITWGFPKSSVIPGYHITLRQLARPRGTLGSDLDPET